MMELARDTTIADLEPPPVPAFALGELVADTYVVRGVLGIGGMGQVYAADDRELQRPVALKTTLDGGAMLRREAQALAQVHHPNVVAVHRVGMHRGVPFMVMERLYGATLADHMRDREVELDEALAILCGIADGLTALHAAGIAHLDLKPGNVILCASGRVALVDLGIMVPEVMAGDRDPCGTPLYMAPELIDRALAPGRACRADFYSFGAMAFELLAGRPPFMGADVASVLACHLVDPAPDLCELRGDAPPRLGTLVRTCLAKDAMDRPAGAEEIAWELRAIRARVARDTGRIHLRR
ncbi:MAG TPA: serine/threonine-protein kinase [Kofleriaceae bacterium]|jgi:serine/threonine-protein kinase|nr:serine/threonine-protein kinase [Kofleriaceae bacterium]